MTLQRNVITLWFSNDERRCGYGASRPDIGSELA